MWLTMTRNNFITVVDKSIGAGYTTSKLYYVYL